MNSAVEPTCRLPNSAFRPARRPSAVPDRRRVLDAAGVPQLIEPARDGERRFRAEIALERVPVVADRADDVRRPGILEADLFAEISRRPDEPHDLGLLRSQRLADRLRADAELLGVKHGEMDPA